MVNVTERQLHILLHSLGLPRGSLTPYRNHFVTGEGSDDHADCMALVGMGLMTRRSGNALSGGDDVFTVTDAGIKVAKDSLPPPPKLSRSAKRYRAWLAEDSSHAVRPMAQEQRTMTSKPADAVREALPYQLRYAATTEVNDDRTEPETEKRQRMTERVEIMLRASERIADLEAQIDVAVDAMAALRQRAEQAEAKAEAHARDAAELRALLVRITNDPVWRTNDETLWPDICSAIRRGQP